MRTITLLAASILLAGCAEPVPQETGLENDLSPFVGEWRLVSWTATGSEGIVRHPYGEQAIGQLVYTATGQMSAQLMRSEFDTGAFAEMDGLTALRQIIGTAFGAYWGTYVVDEDAQTVTHNVQGCISPEWVGTTRVRAFRFHDSDNLFLSARLPDADDPGEMNELHWERIR
jgi:hypothetical protein